MQRFFFKLREFYILKEISNCQLISLKKNIKHPPSIERLKLDVILIESLVIFCSFIFYKTNSNKI